MVASSVEFGIRWAQFHARRNRPRWRVGFVFAEVQTVNTVVGGLVFHQRRADVSAHQRAGARAWVVHAHSRCSS